MIFYCMKLSLLTGKSKLPKKNYISFEQNILSWCQKKKKVTFLNSTVFRDNCGANIRNKNMIFFLHVFNTKRYIRKNIQEMKTHSSIKQNCIKYV